MASKYPYDIRRQGNPLLSEMKRCVDEGEMMPNIPQMGRFWRCMAAALKIATSGRSGPAVALEMLNAKCSSGFRTGGIRIKGYME